MRTEAASIETPLGSEDTLVADILEICMDDMIERLARCILNKHQRLKSTRIPDEETFKRLVKEGEEIRQHLDKITRAMRVITSDDLKQRIR